MFTWHQAFLTSVLMHLGCLVLFTFTWVGISKNYEIEFISLGSILRIYDVSVSQASHNDSPEITGVFLLPAISHSTQMWVKGIQSEKPEFVKGIMPISDDHLIRFTGAPVVLDEEKEGVYVDNDIPPAPKMNLRLGVP